MSVLRELDHGLVRKVVSVLDACHSQLAKDHMFSCRTLEHTLGTCLDIRCEDLKKFMCDLSGEGPYVYVAAFYMENCNSQRVETHFEQALAELYGVDSYDSIDRKKMRARFWKEFFSDSMRCV